jgi:hypothetical protein
VNYVSKHTQYHRADLVSNLEVGNVLTDTRLNALTAGFVSRGMAFIDAKRAALEALNGQVMLQANMLSFNDAWVFILIVFVCVSPAILLLRKPKPHPGMQVDAH